MLFSLFLSSYIDINTNIFCSVEHFQQNLNFTCNQHFNNHYLFH